MEDFLLEEIKAALCLILAKFTISDRQTNDWKTDVMLQDLENPLVNL